MLRDFPARIRGAATPEALLPAALFLLVSGLAFLFPLSGDDWAWGSSAGVDRLHQFFAGYNGRYMGNLAALVLTRTLWLTPFVVAATICLVVGLLVRIAGVRTPAGYLASAGLVVAMPLGQWRQTVVWVSGFSNYTLAGFCLLVFVLLVQRDWTRPLQLSRPGIALILAFAVASQLFMEHVTLFLVVASVANVVVQLRRPGRRVTPLAVTWAVGAALGAALMFQNSAYRAAAGDGETYQGIGAAGTTTGHGTVWSIVLQGAGGVSQYVVAANAALNLALFGLILALALVHRFHEGRWARGPVAAVVLAGVATVFSAAIRLSLEPDHIFGRLTGWAWVPALAQFAAILVAARVLVKDRNRSVTISLLAGSVLVLVAPMAAVMPYGPRNFLPSYLVLVAIALLLLAELEERAASPVLPRVVAGLGAVAVLGTLMGYYSVYSLIHQQVENRSAYLANRAHEGARVASVYTLPYPGYVHSPDPLPGNWEDRFKHYEGLPKRFHIKLVDRYPNTEIIPSDDGE